MKLLLHDYSGHAFTAQLGRALACRGIEVVYASFEGFETPKGRVVGVVGDPAHFSAVQIGISGVFDKDNLLKRHGQQREYSRRIRALVMAEKPDGTPRKLMSGDKLRAMGWAPRIGLEQGIEETYRWFRDHVPMTLESA